MFFDYPCCDDVLGHIKQKVCASVYHYMNYQNYKIDTESILKTFSGMIRYTCNNLEGKFVLLRAASALGVTEEIVEILLEIFDDIGIIKIKAKEEDFYQIEFLNTSELSKTMLSTKYSEFVELMNTINEYKNKFMVIDLT